MLDWLTSKVAMSVAVLILIASMIGFFAIQRGELEAIEFQNSANTIANAINEVGRSEANTTLNITFNQVEKNSKGNIYINPLFRSRTFDVYIYHNNIYLIQDDKQVSAKFHFDIHPFAPSDCSNLNLDTGYVPRYQLEDKDQSTSYHKTVSGHDLVIERKLLEVSGHKEYHTFVYEK